MTDKPKTYGEMTQEEKGLLHLAVYEGKDIQVWNHHDDEWVSIAEALEPTWGSSVAYRVKPERETVTLYGLSVSRLDGGWVFGPKGTETSEPDTHRITFALIDGKPDCDSIKMEEL